MACQRVVKICERFVKSLLGTRTINIQILETHIIAVGGFMPSNSTPEKVKNQ